MSNNPNLFVKKILHSKKILHEDVSKMCLVFQVLSHFLQFCKLVHLQKWYFDSLPLLTTKTESNFPSITWLEASFCFCPRQAVVSSDCLTSSSCKPFFEVEHFVSTILTPWTFYDLKYQANHLKK